jgi:hypothetical protein
LRIIEVEFELAAVFVAEHINGKNLHENEFWPVYERAEALGPCELFTKKRSKNGGPLSRRQI